MCRTSAPPRRELYELETELAANEGGFFVAKTKPKPPRVGSTAWIYERPNTIAIFNGGFDVDGTRLDIGTAEPWTAIHPDGGWHHFWTHTEALEWALQEARK